ncbi:protein tolA [Acinetobacter baumannii]|nr:protein tolA [Acinetobacter baumannii]
MLENGDKKWMVQVALAANQANADAVVSKLRAKGYKVTTSPTSKGIRIMVGPAKDRDTADTTRKKITSDASLNMKSAWVIDWVPLDQRMSD